MNLPRINNAFRIRAIFVSRSFKELFRSNEGALRRVGEHVLADLRDFCFARASAFHSDPLIMARRQGRRDVWLRIANYLELDEAQVQQFMEIDDGN